MKEPDCKHGCFPVFLTHYIHFPESLQYISNVLYSKVARNHVQIPAQPTFIFSFYYTSHNIKRENSEISEYCAMIKNLQERIRTKNGISSRKYSVRIDDDYIDIRNGISETQVGVLTLDHPLRS
jgi:hypothetical protein